MSLGVRVKALREEKEMNQKDLAIASKITQATISRIEKGQVKQLKSEALKRLAGALNVTVDYLVGSTNRLAPPEQPVYYLDAPNEVQRLAKNFRQLPDQTRRVVEDFVCFLAAQEKQRLLKVDDIIARMEKAKKENRRR